MTDTHTPGPWVVISAMTVHGKDYGPLHIEPLDPDERLTIQGSGGATSYTNEVCLFHGTEEDEENAALIADAWMLPDLRAERDRLRESCAELVKALAELLREHECLLLASSSHNASRRSIWHEQAVAATARAEPPELKPSPTPAECAL